MAPLHKLERALGLAALTCLGFAGCTNSARHYQVTRETQSRTIARDLVDGIASLPHGMVLHELRIPLVGSDPGDGRSQPQGRD